MTVQLYDLVGADPERPFSPHCWKVRLALLHKGLDFRSVPTRFREIAGVEGGVSKTVPVIRDGAEVVADSFSIALFLEERYPDRPTLFGGPGGQAHARFIERWSFLTLHPFLRSAAVVDIWRMQDEATRGWFRADRENKLGTTLENASAGRGEGMAAFRASLEPLRSTLSFQPWLGGERPSFADYIVFSAFQWARITTRFDFLGNGDAVAEWMERCLDLYGGAARAVPAAEAA